MRGVEGGAEVNALPHQLQKKHNRLSPTYDVAHEDVFLARGGGLVLCWHLLVRHELVRA